MADCRGFVCFSPCCLLISLLIFQFSVAEETPGIIDDCKRSCERSYPLHTYPKEKPFQACKQGCRLSAIEQHSNRVNATESCITGCQESYEDSESVYACYMGCESQHVIPFPASADEGVMPDQWSMKSYMLYIYPALDVGKYCSGFMNRASHYYQMSVAYYYSSDGDRVVVEVNEMPQAYAGVSSFNGDVDGDSDDPQTYDVAYTGLYDDDSSYSYGVVSKGHRWLQCVSQRSGLPMWFLTSTLFLSLFFLMWLCCATASTAPKEKHRKPAVVRELLYLDENSLLEKLPLVQVEEEDEASPLPVKVQLDSTTL